MLIALLAAITFHLGLMNWEFSPRSFMMPSVYLPHSVNVFLTKGKTAAKSAKQFPTEETGPELKQKVVTPLQDPKVLPLQDTVAVEESKVTTAESHIMAEQTIKKPVAVPEPKTDSAVELQSSDVPETGVKAERQDTVKQIQDQNSSETEAEKPSSGTVQLAYPRYKLNKMVPYPGLARKRGQEGTVVLQVLVNRKGRVDDLKIETSSGFGLLDRAAVAAVKNWSFEPGRKDRDPEAMWVRVPVVFELKQF
jgi:protein TonB